MIEKNCFISSDFSLRDIERDSENFDRYEYTESLDSFLEFVEEEGTAEEKEKAEALSASAEKAGFHSIYKELNDLAEDEWNALYQRWSDNISYEEQWEVPMMNALYYYPSFVSFENEDRHKIGGSITLLYDSEEEAWAVGMTGGGMDLTPHLLEAFITLGKGVPVNVAENTRANYSAYVNEARHAENCRMLARAFINNGLRDLRRYKELTGEELPELERHVKGIEKLLEKE